jgi:tetratricopeptide (TPR) repeat protein
VTGPQPPTPPDGPERLAATEGADAAQRGDDPRRWRELAAEGRFEAALRSRLVAVGEGAEPDDADDAAALRALADAQGLLREKAWRRAARRIVELEARPDWLDVEAAAADLAVLADAGAALDARDVDASLEALARFAGREDGPFEAERLTQLGTARVLDGDDEEARRCFAAALERDPKHPRALVNLGNVALEDGEVDEAIALYERALAVDDGFANAHHNLGVAYRRKGEIGKSVRALRRAQKAERARDATAARDEVRGLGRRLSGRNLRWLLWGVVAAAVVWVLLERGG